ncbi:hypothetical protein HMN09_00108400 [Mycena chlorophos]|uniref:Uncharacterized protein n=1 Tax=Mycena chlorophos TaxID=658473 RepID=A0A8H6TV27_MYCCL|nr:hypothetical protein HMN09_00108400 [Mycena chlorophos]
MCTSGQPSTNSTSAACGIASMSRKIGERTARIPWKTLNCVFPACRTMFPSENHRSGLRVVMVAFRPLPLSMADTLEPIVIPPLVAGKFTCSGAGLRYEEQERVAPDILRTLLLPSGARNGIADRERPKAWWGAQSLFYGLKHTKTMTITQLRAQLEDALRANKEKGSLRVPQDILDLEHRSNQEFRELNAQVRDKTGLGGGKTQGAKTKKRKLEDDAPKEKGKGKEKAVEEVGGPQKKQRTKKTDADIPAAAGKPRAKPAPKATPPAEVKPAAARPKQTARKGTGILAHPTAASNVLDIPYEHEIEAKPHTKQTARGGPRSQKLARRTDATSGEWDITCPYINQRWPQCNDSMFLFNIVTRATWLGTSLECEFDFDIFRGFIRSTRVEPRLDGVYATFEWAGKEDDGPLMPPNHSQTGYIKFTTDRLKGVMNGVSLCGGDLEFEGEWQGFGEPLETTWEEFCTTVDQMPRQPATKQTARKTTTGIVAAPNPTPHSTQPTGSRTKQTARKITGGKPPPLPRPTASELRARPDATSGFWAVTAPYITQEWNHEELSFNIVTRNNNNTLECEFELGIFRGLIRSTRLEARPDGAYATVEWAGKEEDGPVCCPDPRKTGYIKFTGNKLKGKLMEVPACGEDGLSFQGEWMGPPNEIWDRWENYDQAAYDRANRARWGRSGSWY